MPRKRVLPKDDPLPRHRRKVLAEGLIYRFYLEKKPLAQCWLEVHPDSTASERSRREMASAEMNWYRRAHPLGVEQLLLLKQMGVSELLDELKSVVFAKEQVKIGVQRESAGEGGYVDTYGFEERVPLKIKLEAIKLWAQVLGLIGGGRPGVTPPGEQSPDDDQRNVTGSGVPVRKIHGADPMTHDEWMAEWEQLQEDRRKRREVQAQRERDGLTDDDAGASN